MPARSQRRLALLAVVIAWLASACGQSTPGAPTSPPPQIVRTVVVLGDSLAVYPSLDQSFPARLQYRIDQGSLKWKVTNAGVSGDTTADGLARIDPLLTSEVGVMVLELGANDGLRGIPVAAIETNLSTMIERAQVRGIRVLLCGMETPPTHGFDYSVAFHLVFPRIAQRYQTAFVPFLLAGALTPDMTGPDGVHPNAAGAERIAENVWPYLDPLLQSSP